jgi:hypothetical protein
MDGGWDWLRPDKAVAGDPLRFYTGKGLRGGRRVGYRPCGRRSRRPVVYNVVQRYPGGRSGSGRTQRGPRSGDNGRHQTGLEEVTWARATVPWQREVGARKVRGNRADGQFGPAKRGGVRGSRTVAGHCPRRPTERQQSPRGPSAPLVQGDDVILRVVVDDLELIPLRWRHCGGR